MWIRIRNFVLIFAVAWGAVVWLAEPGNGKQLGSTGGQVANKAGDAVGGAGDGITAFFRNATK